MRIDLTDTTFIIPVRIDSMIRLENLLMSVDSIVRYFRTRILILEASSYQNEIIPSLIKDDTVKYTFLVDKDPVFYKTKYLNILAKQVDTPLVCIWDADVILDHLQILDAVKQLRTRTSDVAYPYDGNFLDTSDILREHYWLHRDLDFLKKHQAKMNSLYTVEGVIGAVGGAVFAQTEKYLQAGMENEDFYGWGLEDGERHYRWLSFGYRIYRSEGCLFHLSHPRDQNGMFRSRIPSEKAMHDMNEVVNYSKEELREKFSLDSR